MYMNDDEISSSPPAFGGDSKWHVFSTCHSKYEMTLVDLVRFVFSYIVVPHTGFFLVPFDQLAL
jgi:hypothetical protein